MKIRFPAIIALTAGLALSPCLLLALTPPGTSDNGLLVEEWHYDMHYYTWGYFGSSPGIADLGIDVNNVSGEPAADLEIVTGSDEVGIPMPDGSYASGLWYCFDSQGGLEWYTDTQSDESRGSVAIVDINADGHLEIAGGTTSGETVEVMDRFGNFVWTFPTPPHAGGFMWPAAPAVIDVLPGNNGLEVIIANRPQGIVYALDGDNSDATNDGYVWGGGWPWVGTEGTDWDIIWVYNLGAEIYASTAVGDVDGDGTMEAIVGSTNGTLAILDAQTGALETSFSLGSIYASAALGDLDNNGLLDIIIGSTNGTAYCIEWNGAVANTKWTYNTGGAIWSSAALGDVDGDGSIEIVFGSNDGNVYCLNGLGGLDWMTPTGGAVYSSPALANRIGFGQYGNEWPMFRNNPARTGLYGGTGGSSLGVYVGSEDEYFYLIDGADGSVIDRFRVRAEPSGMYYPGVHTSAAVGDVDGDSRLEFFFTDWGSTSTKGGHTFWAVEDVESQGEIPVFVDIKPQSCPNPLNVRAPKSHNPMVDEGHVATFKPTPDYSNESEAWKAKFPVAILGTADFDVSEINPNSVTIAGLSALRWNIEDVSTPVPEGVAECACTSDGPDGFLDLTLKFCKSAIVEALGEVHDGDIIVLTITGELYDGRPFEGTDCVWIRGDSDGGDGVESAVESSPEFVLLANAPNPFNANTVIFYGLREAGQARLEIFDMLGRRVRNLVDDFKPAGVHEVIWNGTNDRSESVASGIYFYRLTTRDLAESRKMILMK